MEKTIISNRQLEIIDAAGKILTTFGVSGLTTKNLAKELQFSEGAIYRHFASKEEIIIAMLELLAVSMDERLTRVVANENSPELKFKAVFKSQFDYFHDNPHLVVAVFCDGLMEESEKINASILKLMAVKLKFINSIINEGQLDGTFNPSISLDDLTHIVLGSFRLQMFKWRASNFSFNINDKGTALIESLFTLIKN